MIGNVFIDQLTFFKEIDSNIEIIPFSRYLFVIKSEYFAQKTVHFACFKEHPSTEFKYDIRMITY